MTLAGFREAAMLDGEAEVESETCPEKPLTLETVIVDEFDEPGWNVIIEGLPERLKSGPTVIVCVTFLVAPT